jgi:hypothetical protein
MKRKSTYLAHVAYQQLSLLFAQLSPLLLALMQLPLLHTLVERVRLPGVLDIVLVGLAPIF